MVSYAIGCVSFYFFVSYLVGWVERSETHHVWAHLVDGFRYALPILQKKRWLAGSSPAMTAQCRYFFGGDGHGRCAPRRPSNALAMPSTPRSSKRRPTICTPIGKPLAS